MQTFRRGVSRKSDRRQSMLYLIFGCAVIVVLIALGFKTAADAKVEEIERSVNRRADKLARQMMHERLDGLQIQVTQRIAVVYDDLKKEDET